ncbi:GyrI-like domain-containing protein [Saccharopolyspora sp. 5N708]|uniref:GyrI-like domain-containing protein n=1 Tax=Saccharopolyspora sp. 5N708 TaxID=3457424 RepID=UPI003FCEE6B5
MIQGLYDDLCAALDRAGLPVNVEPNAAFDFAVVDLPAVEKVATIVHRGSMDDCLPTYQALARWIEDNGYRTTWTNREVTLACPEDPAGMVTEIQEPIATI